MQFIIDRFEGNFAVIEFENGKILNIPKELFDNAKEGDVFDIIFNKDKTAKRAQNIRKKLDSLFDN